MSEIENCRLGLHGTELLKYNRLMTLGFNWLTVLHQHQSLLRHTLRQVLAIKPSRNPVGAALERVVDKRADVACRVQIDRYRVVEISRVI